MPIPTYTNIPGMYQGIVRYGSAPHNHSFVSSVQILQGVVSLTSYGLSAPNVYAHNWRTNLAKIPDRPGAIPFGPRLQDVARLHFTGAIATDDAKNAEFFKSIYGLNVFGKLAAAAESIDSYLVLSVSDGTSLTDHYRRYIRPENIITQMQQYSRLTASSQFSISITVSDPFWYIETATVVTEDIVGGSGPITISGSGGTHPTQRLLMRIKKTTADNPTDIVISNGAGDSFTLTGSLTTADEYWVVDMFRGKVRKGTAKANEVNDIAAFSGEFIAINGTDTISVNESGTADFEVRTEYLGRVM